MGTDIHAALEYRPVGRKWLCFMWPNRYAGKWEGEGQLTARVPFDRDYDLFAILAGVRNGRGFAGVDLGDGFDPIAEDRGVPKDISKEARGVLSDEHSPTWVRLDEILAYDWTRVSKHRGVVNAVEFEAWDCVKDWKAAPDSFCGDVGGANVKHITEDQMRALVSEAKAKANNTSPLQNTWRDAVESLKRDHPHTYCKIEWGEGYAESGSQLWRVAMPQMLKLGAKYGTKNVRLVMDFDS